MADTTNCPEASQLGGLLESELTDEQEAALTLHLKGCQTCRARLDEITGRLGLLSERAKGFIREQPAPDKALAGLIERLRSEGPGDAGATGQSDSDGQQAPAEAAVDFLEPSDQPGHLGRLGTYEITQIIGQVGMGVVLKGHDSSLNRVVAIKVLNPQLASNATARKRFRREAQAAAAVSHDHVVTIHAVDEANGLPFIVMELESGVSLDDRIKRSGPLKLEGILRIGMQTAAGLAAAHAQGLVHWDVKPSNILLENGVERVKITDFGLARAADDVNITQTGVVAGTPSYMSPEQAQGKTVDHRSDLFSLGCVLYAMCTGRSPFRASTIVDAIRRVCDDSPRPIQETNSKVPEWLAHIVGRLLDKNPDNRIQSAAELTDLLGGHLAHLQQPSTAPRPLPLAASRVPTSLEPPRPLRWKWITLAAAILIMAGVAIAEITGLTGFTRGLIERVSARILLV